MPARRIVRDVNEAARDIARREMKAKVFLESRDQRKRAEMRLAHVKTHHGFERMRLRGLSVALAGSDQQCRHHQADTLAAARRREAQMRAFFNSCAERRPC